MDKTTERAIGAHFVEYRGYRIKVKLDFGDRFFLIDGLPCMWGYVVTDADDVYNAMPGATWFQTVKDAKHGIDALVRSKGNVADFWRRIRKKLRSTREAA